MTEIFKLFRRDDLNDSAKK